MKEIPDGNVKLQSQKSSRLLQQIASLRANDVGNHINLPQLVVCGDQSAGKSSVLNGLICIPFPRADGACTKFATEIIIEHTGDGEKTMVATIIPHEDRDEASSHNLRSFRKNLQKYTELPDIIAEAASLMGLRGYGNNTDGPGFALDVLRINVSGNTGMHLAVVDLPGLISVTADERHEGDKDIVHHLVDGYLKNPRTIILAVMQAGNDVANQPIIGKARRFDKDGARTIGIITKPDLINKGSESRIAQLAGNKDHFKLRLGFFILKNPEPHEIDEGLPYEVLQANELKFFLAKRWQDIGLDQNRVGISSLRNFVKNKLDQHIRIEMPKVRDEIRQLLREKEPELQSLGPRRETATDLRVFLTKLSQEFQALVSAGLRGSYEGPEKKFFGLDSQKGDHVRLRALIHRLNTDFSRFMSLHGAKRAVATVDRDGSLTAQSPPRKKRRANAKDESTFPTLGPSEMRTELISQEDMMNWISEVHSRTRGQELPGESNPSLLSQLFHEQSSHWLLIGRTHILNVHHKVGLFMREALDFIVPPEIASEELHATLENLLEDNLRQADTELQRLAEDELQQPITYNYSYTEDVQKSRRVASREPYKVVTKTTTQNGFSSEFPIMLDASSSTRTESIAQKIDKGSSTDMDKRTCSEAFDALQAYYRVARKTWVDNVCRQVIERHLLRRLAHVFDAANVAAMNEDEMARLAEEVPGRAEKRRELEGTVQSLRQGLRELLC